MVLVVVLAPGESIMHSVSIRAIQQRPSYDSPKKPDMAMAASCLVGGSV